MMGYDNAEIQWSRNRVASGALPSSMANVFFTHNLQIRLKEHRILRS